MDASRFFLKCSWWKINRMLSQLLLLLQVVTSMEHFSPEDFGLPSMLWSWREPKYQQKELNCFCCWNLSISKDTKLFRFLHKYINWSHTIHQFISIISDIWCPYLSTETTEILKESMELHIQSSACFVSLFHFISIGKSIYVLGQRQRVGERVVFIVH